MTIVTETVYKEKKRVPSSQVPVGRSGGAWLSLDVLHLNCSASQHQPLSEQTAPHSRLIAQAVDAQAALRGFNGIVSSQPDFSYRATLLSLHFYNPSTPSPHKHYPKSVLPCDTLQILCLCRYHPSTHMKCCLRKKPLCSLYSGLYLALRTHW